MTDGHGPEIGAGSPGRQADALAVPLFPLPNVVMFPKAVLPLHIFEERYKAMTRDALAGRRLVAMAVLRPGWEKSYYGRPPVEPVVCVGKILSHEELPDGRFNFLLQGVARAQLVGERPSADPDDSGATAADDPPYRVGLVRSIPDVVLAPADDAVGRASLLSMLSESAVGRTPLGRKFADLARTEFPVGDLIDLIAFNFVEDVAAKQAMLAEAAPGRRLPLLLDALGVPARQPVSDSVRRARGVNLN